MAEVKTKLKLVPRIKMKVWRVKTQKWEEIKQEVG